MSSDGKKEERRATEGKSTGPRTRHGKSRSSLNAITHGAFAKAAVIPGEDPEAFAALRESLWRDLAPQGALEEVLVHRIAMCLWRLVRATRAEGEVLKQAADVLLAKAFIEPAATVSEYITGSVFSNGGHTSVQRINRYEASIDRLLQRALNELERARARRNELQSTPSEEAISEPPPGPGPTSLRTPPIGDLEDLIERCTPAPAADSSEPAEA